MNSSKVLIIEDDADVRFGYEVLLQAHHYETFCAVDGISAMREASKHRPDLILLDLGIPGDGFVVLDRLRSDPFLSKVPVIVVSGRDPQANRNRALQAGARAYLQKPWNNEDLIDQIRQLMPQSLCKTKLTSSARTDTL